MSTKQVTTRQLRSFGLIVGTGFALIAFAPVILHGHSPRNWAIVVTLIMGIPAVVLPRVLRPLYRVWMMLAEVLAWVNTRIILLFIYYVVIVPFGAMLRIMGKDPMRLKFEANTETYRVPRVKRPANHMQHQY
jgi:hypothetical protein